MRLARRVDDVVHGSSGEGPEWLQRAGGQGVLEEHLECGGAVREEARRLWVRFLEVLGDREGVGDRHARSGVVDDGEQVCGASVGLQVGCEPKFIVYIGLDVREFDPFCLVWESFEVQAKSVAASQ